MREIKFRAWDKDRECFLPVIVGNTDIKDDNWICPLTFCEVNGEKNWYHNETCEIMQYTGLHDKNDKEIYEGDILKYEWDGKTKIDYIVFSGGMFTYSKCVRWSLNKDEIIGNIDENPELLKH